MKNWDNVVLVPEFDEQGVACYRLEGGDYENEYYVISEAESRKLLNTPEIVGYEVYNCLVSSTSQMLYYLKEQKKVTTANILSILRGALNYPLEEACYREHIRVHDISFLSSERVFEKEEIAGLEVQMEKAASDFVKLKELMDRKAQAESELDAKMERWMYLNDLAEKIEKQ